MKYLTRDEFVALEGEVLFQKYEPESGWLNRMCIKRTGPKMESDWFESKISDPSTICESAPHACWCVSEVIANFPSQLENFQVCWESCGRDGCYVDEDMFVVYDADDVKELIKNLEKCLPFSPAP